jgi:hypothetical protein
MFKYITAGVLVGSLLLTGLVSASPNKDNRESGTVKILLTNPRPNEIYSVFQGWDVLDPYAVFDREPNGGSLLESVTPASPTGLTEIFVPVGMTSAVWGWTEKSGYRFIGNVSPSDSDNVITLTE